MISRRRGARPPLVKFSAYPPWAVETQERLDKLVDACRMMVVGSRGSCPRWKKTYTKAVTARDAFADLLESIEHLND